MARSSPTGLGTITRRAVVRDSEAQFWDIKFYPYIIHRDDPVIFAVLSADAVYIYQAIDEEEAGIRLIACYRQPHDQLDSAETFNSCSWCYANEDVPLLAMTGESGHIVVIEAMTGKHFTTLVGHGVGIINDLAAHPIYPWIVASASIDTSIRVWDLRRANIPTLSSSVVICGHGLAHKEALISISWHANGRYIVSSGHDYKICVWTLPDLSPDSDFWDEISKEGRQRSRDEVRIIYYPHFASSAIHNNNIDHVMFIGDLILSKAADEEEIVLWSITGFRGAMEPPPELTAVKTREHLESSNGFMRKPDLNPDDDLFDPKNQIYNGPELFKRCLTFKNDESKSFFMRFGLSKPSTLFPEVNLILTAGDHQSHVRHWDLETLISGGQGRPKEVKKAAPKSRTQPSQAGRAQLAVRSSRRVMHEVDDISNRDISKSATPQTRDSSTDAKDAPSLSETGATTRDRNRYPLHDPEKALKHHAQHNEQTVIGDEKKIVQFTTRGVSWSVCGKWCVAVGESVPSVGDLTGTFIVYRRQQQSAADS